MQKQKEIGGGILKEMDLYRLRAGCFCLFKAGVVCCTGRSGIFLYSYFLETGGKQMEQAAQDKKNKSKEQTHDTRGGAFDCGCAERDEHGSGQINTALLSVLSCVDAHTHTAS